MSEPRAGEPRAELSLSGAEHVTIRSPEGLIFVSTLPKIGTQVVVYDTDESAPVATIHLKEITNV